MVLPFFTWCYRFTGQGISTEKETNWLSQSRSRAGGVCPACAFTAHAGVGRSGVRAEVCCQESQNKVPWMDGWMDGWMDASRRMWQAGTSASSRSDGLISRAVLLPDSKLCPHIPSLMGQWWAAVSAQLTVKLLRAFLLLSCLVLSSYILN